MISGVMDVPYYEDKLVQVVKLPLKSDGQLKFGVYFLLPRVNQTQDRVEVVQKYGNRGYLKRIPNFKNLPFETVNVSIPEFVIEYSDDLVDDLKKMNITSMFDPMESDFSSISSSKNLFVKHVQHKAFIAINQNGIEAAASTTISIIFLSYIHDPRTFLADHPFLFHVTVQAKGEHFAYEHFLFSGQCID